ncbi:hypothetical protein J6590_008907 [Homalodisca vitripennis]|nr:hypothetical protein J6590_008907 [Homalodisca vitripennis]
MDRDHLTVSEVDRQLLSDLSGSDNDSNFSLSDTFDDTDEDPTYTPEQDTQPRFVSRNSPTIGSQCDSDTLVQPGPSTRPTLPRPTVDRRVFSDSSSESDNDDHEELFGSGFFQHRLSFPNTPKPQMSRRSWAKRQHRQWPCKKIQGLSGFSSARTDPDTRGKESASVHDFIQSKV